MDFSFVFKRPLREDVPAAYKYKPVRRQSAMLSEAAQVLKHLPEPGEQLHAIMTGRYDLMAVLSALFSLRAEHCTALVIATLSYNVSNLGTMVGFLDQRKVGSITLLCSKFFKENQKSLYNQTREEFMARGQRWRLPGRTPR